jgi:hypothetical protein
MDYALRGARLYGVPVAQVMHRDMLHNWRRRIKRLERARITAPPVRRMHIELALRRLTTGRLHP